MIGGSRGDFRRTIANDNPGPVARIEASAMRFARLLGCQIVHGPFEAHQTTNDDASGWEADER